MNINNWEKGELVDAYVDDECSPSEREFVEALLRDDVAAEAAFKWALHLRAQLSAIRTETPPEFSQRLTSALNESDVWSRYGSEIDASRTSERSRRTKWVPAIVGASAAAIAVVAFGLAYSNLHSSSEAPHSSPRELVEADPEVSSSIQDLQDPALGRPPIQTPSPAGVQVANGERSAVPESFRCVVLLKNAAEHKSLNSAIKAKCGELDVNYSKFDSNRELTINKATPQAWRELQQTLEATGKLDISTALQKWSADGVESDIRDVRVSIRFAEPTPTDASEKDE